MSQSNTRLARVRTARRPHVCPAPARCSCGRGVACIVVGSELDLELGLARSPLAPAGRRASGPIVRVFDAVCFEKCVGKRRWELCEHERDEGARQTSASF